ncbi:MAG: hypothetical protein DYG92_09475 [Leptolyngbya sp. PLA1]|nr:hypothetical protein [Leptolyngbya sp. PLA1]
MRSALLIASCAGVLWGCAGVQPPAVRVTGTTLRERTADAAVLDVVLDVDNTGPDALPLRNVLYSVWLADRLVFQGTRSASATAAGFSRCSIVLPASVTGDPASSGTSITVKGEVFYDSPRVFSRTMAEAGLSSPSVTFSHQGEVDLATPAPAPRGTARTPTR